MSDLEIKPLMHPKSNFLVVDDLPDMKSLIKRHVKKFGITGKIFTADSGNEARKIMEDFIHHRYQIECVIADWMMPDGSGIELLRWIRSHEVYKNTPFLMITTKSEMQSVAEAIEAGASDFIIKPWGRESLFERINNCWEKHYLNQKKDLR